MSKKYKIVVNVGKNENNEVIEVAQKQGDRGQTLRIQAKAGAKYQLQEVGKDQNAAPEYVRVKRVGKNLHLIFEDGLQSDVIIEDYYGVMPEGYNGIVGETEQGIFYEYIPEDPNTSGLIPRLADGGELVSVALGGGEVVGSGAAIGILAFNPLLAALGLAGAGVAAAAAGAASAATSDAPKIVAVTDNVGNPGGANVDLVSGGPTNDNTPTLSGTTTPNAVVTVKDGDTVLGTTTAGSDGKWSFTPTTALGEGQHSLTASTTNNGTTSTSAPFVVEVDTKPPVATLALDPVTADNLVSVQEAGLQSLPVTGKVTGGFKAGDIVTVSVNGKPFTGTVNAEGIFSINVPTAELAADPDTKLEATIALTDAAGNTGTASGVMDYNLQPGVGPNTAPVNNLPTAPQTAVGGIGKLLTGLTVSDVDGNLATVKLSVLNGVLDVSLNGTTVSSGANGSSTLTLSGTQAQINAALASLTYKPNVNFVGVDNLSIVSTDSAGTPLTDADNLSITVTPAGPLTSAIILNPVTGDNIISPTEGNQSTVSLTGKVAGPFTVGDVVTVSINDKSVTGAVNATGEFSIPVNMSDLKADTDKTIQANVLVKDPVTGQTQVASNSQTYAVETTPGTGLSLQLNTVTTDNIINKAESQNANTAVAGKVNGTVANGDIVSLQINTKTFTTVVDAQGNFSVNVPTSDLLADADTHVNASVLSSTGQTKATAIQNYAVDTAVPVASVIVNNLTPDNLISAQEAAQATLPVTGKVTGEFRPGDVVSVVVNDKTLTAAVDAQGNFSLPVPTADLLADPDTKLQVSVLPTDASGNSGQSATAELDYATTVVLPPETATVIFAPVAGDNIISAAEGSQPTSTLTGKVTGPFTVGDVVTVSINDKSVTGAVNAAGEFSIPVNMTDLKADADKTVQASVLAKDPVTGQTQVASNSQTYAVENTPGTGFSLQLNAVTTDNIINKAESLNANTAVAGKVNGTVANGDIVSLQINSKTFTTVVDAQGNFSVNVPTSDLLADADTQVNASVLSSTGQTKATATQNYAVDTAVPVATVSVNNITPDNLISAQEAAQATLPVTGKVTGEFRPGDVVSVSVNDKTYTAAVDAQGNFSLPVPTADLLADPDTKLQVSVLPTDASGNPGQSAIAELDYATGVNPSTNAAVIFNPVAGDNIISAAEGSQSTSTLTGKVTGPFTVGDVVTVSINDKSVTGAVNAAGEFSIPVNMSDLKADADKTVQASVLAKDPVTGQTQMASNSQTYGVDATGNPDTALVLDTVAGDNLINAVEAASLNTAITGKVTGEFAPGDVVTVYVNNKTFTTAVNAQGQFSVSVPTAHLLVDADSKIEATAVATTAMGLFTAVAAQDYSFDTTPPVASVSVNNITSDNLISAQEAAQATLPVTGKVTGEFRPGDVVSVSVNNKTFTTAVDAQGNFSVPVPTTDLVADPDTQLQVSVLPTDVAGNPGQSATAELDYATGVNPATTAALIFNPVAGDNIISAAEGSQPTSTLTGKVTGPFTVGDVVTVSINNKTVTGTVNALGEFSIPVNMTDLKADADKTVQVSVLAKDPVTGQTQLISNSQTYGVDATGNPDSALVLDAVASDNLINAVEAASLNTAITGKVTGEFAAGDVVSVHVNNNTFTTAVNAQGQFSVSVPTAHLLIDADSKIEASAKVTTATGPVTTTAAQDYVVVTGNVPVTIGASDPDADGKINASGTAEPQSVVTVTWPDGTTSTTTTNPNGAWEVESPNVQREGQVQAVAVRSNDNPSQPATAQYVDNTAPLVNITEPVVQNPNGTLTVSGTSEPGATVVVTGVNGTPVGTATVGLNGQWTLTSAKAVSEGTLMATATDINGETATDTAPYVDNTPPLVNITEPVVQNPNGTLTVSGTGEPGANVVVTGPAPGNTPLGTVTVSLNGQWTLTSPGTVPFGTLTATATDVNGEVGTDTAPYIQGLDISNLDVKDTDGDGKPTVSGQVNKPNQLVTITDPAGQTHTVAAGPDGKFSLELDPAPNPLLGTYTATAVNGADSASESVTETDLTAPVVTNVDVVDTDGDGKPTVGGQTEPNLVVTITDPAGGTHTVAAGPDGKFSLEIDPAPSPLTGPYTVTAVDPAGNTSAPVTVTETDLTAPVITNLDAKDTDGDGKPTVSGLVDTPNSVVTITDPSGTTHTTLAGPTGAFSLELPAAPTPLVGTYTAKALDPAGNTSLPVSVTETDLTAPVVTNVDVVDTDGDGKPTVGGQTEPNLVVTVTDPAGNTHTVAAGPDGKFSLEIDPAPSPLTGPYTVTAVDPAGNTSAPVTVTETDLTAPVITNLDAKDTDGDGKPTVSGLVDTPNSVVTITDPTGGTHTVTAGPTGEFSLELDPAPSQVLGTYSATAKDAAGNVSAPVSIIETDLTGPVITNLDVKDTDGDGKPTVTGLVNEPNLVVTITDPSGGTHTVAAGPDGKFSLELDPAPNPLLGTYTAITVDGSNIPSLLVSKTETDLTAPVVTAVDVKDTDGDGKPTVTGQVDEPNLVVTVTDPAGNTHTVAAGPDGKFSLEIDPAPSPLTGPYTVTAVDPAGNTSAPVTVTETDLTAPVITNLDAKDTDGDGKPTVSGLVDTPNSVVTITDPSGTTHTTLAGATGAFSLELPAAPTPLVGTYTAKAVDPAGNTSLPVSVTETDLTAPVVTNVDVVDTDGDGKPTVTGQVDEPNLVVTVTDPAGNTHTVAAGPDGKFSLEIDPAPSPLTGPYTVTAVDPAGNTSAPVTVTETDLTAPVITNLDAKDPDADGKPTVSGLVDTPNAVVTITDPTGGTHTVTAGPTGEFSLELDPAPSQVLGTYIATAKDAAGNVSAPVSIIETDLTGPVITNLDVKDTDGDGKPTVSGLVNEPNLVVTITDPSGGTHTVAAGPDGKFSLELDPAPNPLLGTYTAITVDGSNIPSLLVSKTATDLTAPVVTNVDVKDTDGDGKPTVTGQVDEPNALVTITDPSGNTHTVAAGPDGKFSLEIDPAPSPLTGPYTVTAVDPAGNTSAPVTVTETDLTAPVVTNVDVVDTDGDGKPTVTGQVDEPNLVVTVTDPAGNTHTVAAGPDGKFSLEIDPAPSPLTGPYTVTAVDPAGNTSAPVTVTETDLTAPVITNLDAKDTDGDGKPTVSGLVDTPNAVVTITDPSGTTHTTLAGPTGAFSLELPAAPTPLVGTYTAKAVDPAGNTSLPVSVTETDLTAPVVTGVDVVDTDGDGKPTITGQVDEPNLVVTVTDPAGNTHTVAAGPDGKFSLEIDPAPSPLTGPYTVTAVDPAGNTSAPVTVTETDLTAPVITNLDAKDTDGDGKPTVSGLVDTPNSVVTITDPSGTTHTTLAGPTGAFSLELPEAPTPLVGTYTAKAVDPAGNTSLPVSVTETDLTAPVITGVGVGDPDGDGKPTVSGQVGEPNLVVTIVDPTGGTHTTVTGPDGAFTIEIDPAPSPSTGTYIVTTVDPEGNTSAPVTGQLGAATPVLIDEPVEQNPDGTITVTGTGEKDAQIEVRDVNLNLVGTTTVLANGKWTLDSVGEVPQGQLTATSTNLNQQITTDTAPYNNTPVAVLDEALGTEDSISLTGNVATNDTHKDGSETYELTSLTTGTHGNLTFESTGAWTYTRTANLDAIQTAVVDTFTYKIKDASGKESTAQLKITLDPVNDAPTVSYTTVQFATYFENAEPVVARGAQVAGGVVLAPVLLNDVDSANLSGATVRVGNFSGANAFMPGDVLTFELPANSPISGVYNSTNGILTFTGTATVAQYQDVLSSVKYSHTKDDYAIDGNRKIFWSVTDDKGLVNPGNLPFSWVVVKRLNDAPVLPDANLVLPNIEPLSTLELPTDVNKFALGISVNNLVTGVTDADLLTSTGQPVAKGVAIIGYNKDMGTLYLSADGGDTWATPSFDVNSSNAILLRGQTNRRVYFQPHVGVEGTIADALTIRAWDASNNVVESVNGLQVTGYNITTVGGTSPYSSTTDTVSLTVATLASSPAYRGTAGDDIINASVGPDVILANGGIDQINADEGNDKVVINESNVQSLPLSNAANLDGGTGVNTLKLTVANMFLDLTNLTVQSKVNNFSVLDITGSGKNTLKIDLSNVQNLSGAQDNSATANVDESKMLVVQADKGDAVVLDNTLSWAALSGLTGDSLATLYGAEYGFIANHKYTQLSKNGATLFVDELAPVADIVGTSGNDALAGTASAEVLFGNGGVDQISAAAGNDTVILDDTAVAALAATNTASVDGGEGVNVLKITGVNVQMDLTDTTVAGKVQNFSVLDLRVGNGNKVKLSLQQVLDLSADVPDNAATTDADESKMLVVHGTNQNTVQLVDSINWTAVTNLGGTTLQNDFGAQFGFEPGRSYTQYTNSAGSATLFVDQLLNVDQL